MQTCGSSLVLVGGLLPAGVQHQRKCCVHRRAPDLESPKKAESRAAVAADIDWKRPRLGTGQANAPTTRAVADRWNPDDRGKTQARALEVVKESATQGRLTGMALIVGDQSAVELVRKKQKEKRLWRKKALKKKIGEAESKTSSDRRTKVCFAWLLLLHYAGVLQVRLWCPVLERSSERERCQDVLHRTRGAEWNCSDGSWRGDKSAGEGFVVVLRAQEAYNCFPCHNSCVPPRRHSTWQVSEPDRQEMLSVLCCHGVW